MAELEGATTAPAAPESAPAPDTGHAPEAPESSAGHAPAPSAADQPEHAPSTGPSRLFKDVDEAESRYKSLQAAYTRITQDLPKYGVRSQQELTDRLSLLQELSGNPDFLAWAQQQMTRATVGSEDPDAQRALEIVQQEAERIAEEKIAPFKRAQLEAKISTTFSEMSKKYGPEWQTLKPKMRDLLDGWKARGLVGPNVDQDFDFEFVEGLFLQAAGRDPEFAAKQYQKRLETKRAAATQSESGTPAAMVAPKEANSMAEAWAAAKREHGMA